ncbi:YqhA family protein, partial [Methylomagnum sp.]
GLFSLFVDDSLPLPKWLAIHDLDDLKSNLVSVVIAVLAVLFLREAVMWDDTHDLPGFGIALAVIIIALTFFLSKKGS